MTGTIPIRNLYYLYAYAWDQFHFVRRIDTGEEGGPEAGAFFAKILVQGCQQLFRRGVDRVYETYEEEMSRLRGRIDLIKTMRHDTLKRGRVWCKFDDLHFDTAQNQLLKATLILLLKKKPVSGELASDIRKCVQRFDSLEVKTIKPHNQAFRRVQLYGNNSFYAFLLHVCELVHNGLFPDDKGGAGQFASVLEDETRMNRIFERFVRNFFRHEQDEFRITSERIRWNVSGGEDEDPQLLPSMYTDVTLRSPQRTVIIETKYYAETLHGRYERKTLRSGHLYQLFAYVKNIESGLGPDRYAQGILLYPTVQEDVVFETKIQGHRIGSRTVDLSQPWDCIRKRLLSVIA